MNDDGEDLRIPEQIKFCKMTRVIRDPFPDETLRQSLECESSVLGKFLWKPKPQRMGIHEAYKQGYDQAYSELIGYFTDIENARTHLIFNSNQAGKRSRLKKINSEKI